MAEENTESAGVEPGTVLPVINYGSGFQVILRWCRASFDLRNIGMRTLQVVQDVGRIVSEEGYRHGLFLRLTRPHVLTSGRYEYPRDDRSLTFVKCAD